jgi:hypothetical protein
MTEQPDYGEISRQLAAFRKWARQAMAAIKRAVRRFLAALAAWYERHQDVLAHLVPHLVPAERGRSSWWQLAGRRRQPMARPLPVRSQCRPMAWQIERIKR